MSEQRKALRPATYMPGSKAFAYHTSYICQNKLFRTYVPLLSGLSIPPGAVIRTELAVTVVHIILLFPRCVNRFFFFYLL